MDELSSVHALNIAGGPSVEQTESTKYDRDIRMCCIRAALDLHRPGETTASMIVSDAKEILAFINRSAQ